MSRIDAYRSPSLMLQVNVAVAGDGGAPTEPVPAAASIPAIRPLFGPAQSGAVERALFPAPRTRAELEGPIIDAEFVEHEPAPGPSRRRPDARFVGGRAACAAYASHGDDAPAAARVRVAA